MIKLRILRWEDLVLSVWKYKYMLNFARFYLFLSIRIILFFIVTSNICDCVCPWSLDNRVSCQILGLLPEWINKNLCLNLYLTSCDLVYPTFIWHESFAFLFLGEWFLLCFMLSQSSSSFCLGYLIFARDKNCKHFFYQVYHLSCGVFFLPDIRLH